MFSLPGPRRTCARNWWGPAVRSMRPRPAGIRRVLGIAVLICMPLSWGEPLVERANDTTIAAATALMAASHAPSTPADNCPPGCSCLCACACTPVPGLIPDPVAPILSAAIANSPEPRAIFIPYFDPPGPRLRPPVA